MQGVIERLNKFFHAAIEDLRCAVFFSARQYVIPVFQRGVRMDTRSRLLPPGWMRRGVRSIASGWTLHTRKGGSEALPQACIPNSVRGLMRRLVPAASPHARCADLWKKISSRH